MLVLGSSKVEFEGFSDGSARLVARISSDPALPRAMRESQMYLSANGEAPEGFLGYIRFAESPGGEKSTESPPIMFLPTDFRYLRDGDVIRMEPTRHAARVLYRRSAPSNSLLLTERCNNLCLMCSQPPKDIDDSWHVNEILEVLRLADRATPELILSGGEPTLLGPDLLKIIRAAKGNLPDTALHVLSNGRRFSELDYSRAFAATDHPDLMTGIPLYSDLSTVHNYVVQADGAYDETIRGILNLKQCGQAVEIRVVVHKQTCARLPELARFIARNLTFVDHVALMGLELTGFTLANLDDVWIDPWDYRAELLAAVEVLAAAQIRVSIYNHQLCVLDPRARGYAVKSISDWKNEYFEECTGCESKSQCGGFFSTSERRRSEHISPILNESL